MVEVIVTNVVVGDENIEIDQNLNLFELGLDSLGSREFNYNLYLDLDDLRPSI